MYILIIGLNIFNVIFIYLFIHLLIYLFISQSVVMYLCNLRTICETFQCELNILIHLDYVYNYVSNAYVTLKISFY